MPKIVRWPSNHIRHLLHLFLILIGAAILKEIPYGIEVSGAVLGALLVYFVVRWYRRPALPPAPHEAARAVDSAKDEIDKSTFWYRLGHRLGKWVKQQSPGKPNTP